MGQIYEHLDGIDNAIQSLSIQATDSNVTIIKAILNTIKTIKNEAAAMDKRIEELENEIAEIQSKDNVNNEDDKDV